MEKIFLELVKSREVVNEILEKFTDDSTKNNEKIKLVLNQMRTQNLLPFKKDGEVKILKSSDKSIEYRNSGNMLYSKKDWMGALSFYSKSIAAAPYPLGDDDKSVELAVAFANRSAVLFAMTKYEACLQDIDNALKFDYPDNLTYKLLERQGKCLQQLGHFNGASKCIQKSIDFLPLATSLSKQVIESTLQRLETLYIETAKKSDDPVGSPKNAPAKYVLPKQATDFLGNLSIKSSEENGRYVVASRNINPGEVLLVEDPYAAIVLPEYYSTHCTNCLRRFSALIPCKKCSLAMFCSEKCQKEAMEEYHSIECTILPKLLDLEMKYDWILALRLLLVASHKSIGMKSFLNKINNLNDSDLNTNSDKFKAQFESDPDYSMVHCLVHNFGKRTYKDVYKLALIVACIVNCLETFTDIFSFDIEKDSGGDGKKACTDPRNVIGGLLLQYLQCVQCNSYTTAELLFKPKGENQLETVMFGSGVYKFASLFNHSCDPNTVRSNHNGSSLAIIASMPIKKGTEICCDYGYQFYVHERALRQMDLKASYFFDCKCCACKNDWPLAVELDPEEPAFLCAACQGSLLEDKNPIALLNFGELVCGSCNKRTRYARMMEDFQPIVDHYYSIKSQLLAGRVFDFTPELGRMVSGLDKMVQKPSKLLLDIQDTFRHCAMQLGNFYYTI